MEVQRVIQGLSMVPQGILLLICLFIYSCENVIGVLRGEDYLGLHNMDTLNNVISSDI